jgi:hypothetical protein
MDELFQSREKRDARAAELKREGYDVLRTTIRGQQLHPMYVADWPYELSQAEKGFGNTLYRTYFPVLYKVEAFYDLPDAS